MRKILILAIFICFLISANSTQAAEVQITALPEATEITSDDLLLIVDSPAASATTKKITVTNFLCGNTALERGDIVYYNGTNMKCLKHGTAGNPLITGGNGADPSWAGIVIGIGTNTFSLTNGTSSLDIAAAATLDVNFNLTVNTAAVTLVGKSGGSSLTLGTALSLDGTMTNTYLCKYTTTGTIISCDVNPDTFSVKAGSSSIVTVGALSAGSLATGFTPVTVPLGGTGLASGTEGGIPWYTTTTAIASSALLAQYGVMIGGGVDAAPSTITASTTTTHALFATAGAPAFRALATADLPAALPAVSTIATSLTLPDIILTSVTAGSRLTGGNGLITIKGEGDGTDEDLTINLNVANTATVSTSTGVADIKFQGATTADPLNLATTGTILGAIKVIDMGATAATYTVLAPDAYGSLYKQTHNDGATVVTLADYQAAADVDHVKIGASVCFLTLTAFATVVTASADDKIRSSAGVLSGAAGTCTGPATVGAYACFILTETATDIGIWQQMGTNGTWATSAP